MLFLLSCLGAFLLLGQVFPAGLKIGDYNIRFFKVKNLIEQAVTNKEIRAIDKSGLIQLQQKAAILAEEDTLISGGKKIDEDLSNSGFRPIVEFHIDSASGIQYPAGDSTILNSFFQSLDSARRKEEIVRILHIGDSQIEGDRISGYLRQRLQQQFGGCGPGLIPFSEETVSRMYLRMDGYTQTKKFQLLGKGLRGEHTRYSLFHSYFRLKQDSGQSNSNLSGTFAYHLNNLGYRRNGYFENATLLLRNRDSRLELNTSSGNRSFAPSDSLRFSTWNMGKPSRNFSVSMETGAGTDFYGVCLDCKSGVALDNIPLRGSSGLELLKINPKFLQEQIRRLNTRLVILQFGVNVVPYDASSYNWYENNLVKIISTIKNSAPGIQVLVIGVSDMARKKNGIWGSFETIPRVISAQQNACARTNSAFWDMYQVMGGKNAIIAWSKTSPPLAGKDLIHLTPKGAQVVGEFLFQAIQKEISKN